MSLKLFWIIVFSVVALFYVIMYIVKNRARLIKLKDSFSSEPRVDADSKLTNEELRKISLGNLYVYQQNGTLNTLSTGVNETVLDTILTEYWDITDRDSAISTLSYLMQTPSAYPFVCASKAFVIGGEEGKKWMETQLMESFEGTEGHEEEKKELLDRCHEMLGYLEENYGFFKDLKWLDSKEDMEKLGILAWDAGRLNFVARACMDKKLISKEECMECVEHAYELTREAYADWTGFAHSYVIGRSLWNGSTNMWGLADDLLESKESPWTYVAW